jgi:hypothetical protein
MTNEMIKKAWRANRNSEAIEPIPTDEIECYTDDAFAYR